MITASYCSMKIYNNKRGFLNDPLNTHYTCIRRPPAICIFIHTYIHVHYPTNSTTTPPLFLCRVVNSHPSKGSRVVCGRSPNATLHQSTPTCLALSYPLSYREVSLRRRLPIIMCRYVCVEEFLLKTF